MPVPHNSMMAPTQFTKLFTVYSAVLGYSMSLIYALTMERQEDTYKYGYILAFAQERNPIIPFIGYDRFQDCKYKCDLTTTKCTRMLFTTTVVGNIFFFWSNTCVYDNRK